MHTWYMHHMSACRWWCSIRYCSYVPSRLENTADVFQYGQISLLLSGNAQWHYKYLHAHTQRCPNISSIMYGHIVGRTSLYSWSFIEKHPMGGSGVQWGGKFFESQWIVPDPTFAFTWFQILCYETSHWVCVSPAACQYCMHFLCMPVRRSIRMS